MLLTPDRRQAARGAAEERARLDAARARLDAADVAAVVEQTQRAQALQEAPDSPEALATIPTLTLADLPRTNKPIPIAEEELAETPCSSLTTSSPTASSISTSASTCRRCRAAAALRAAVRPRAVGDRRRQRGFRLAVAAHRPLDRRHRRQPLDLDAARRRRHARPGSSCAARRCPSRPASCCRSCATSSPRAARQPRALPPAGAGGEGRVRELARRRATASSRAAARQLHRGRLGQRADGRRQLLVLPQGSSRDRHQLDGVLAALEGIRTPAARPRAACSPTSPPTAAHRGAEAASSPTSSRPAGGAGGLRGAGWGFADGPLAEGLTIPAQVNYVGKGADLNALGVKPSGATAVAIAISAPR